MIAREFASSSALLFMLLNPFLLIIYLQDLAQQLDGPTFNAILRRAGLIAGAVFAIFALLGEWVFRVVLQARFESFQIFGGVIFLLIGIRFVFAGNAALTQLRGCPEHVAGAIAMPIMIGPGTVSAAILAGNRLPGLWGVAAVLVAVAGSVAVMSGLKGLHDFVRPRNEKLIERYIEIMGRVTALVVGTFSVEMIMQGLKRWFATL